MYKTILFFFLLTGSLLAQFSEWESITNFNNVKDIAVRSDQVWCVSDGGAFSYNTTDKSVRKFTNIDGLSSVNLAAVELDERNNLIFGASNGALQLYNPDADSWADIRFDGENVSDLIVAGDTMWVAINNGVAVFLWDGSNYEFSDIFLNYPELINSINDIVLFEGRIWMASDKGLLSAPSNFSNVTLTDPQNWEIITENDGLQANTLNAVTVHNNRLWIGSTAGLAYLSENSAVVRDALLGDHNITNLEDFDTYLLASNQRTIYQYEAGNGIARQKTYGWVINAINTMGQDIWLGSAGEGLVNFEASDKVKLDGPLKNQVRYIIRDENGNTWASSGKFKLTPNFGYFVFNGDTWTSYDFSGENWSNLGNTAYLYNDRFGNVWMGTWGGGVAVYDGEEFNYFHNHSDTGVRYATTVDTTIGENLSDIPSEYKDWFSPITGPQLPSDYLVITAIKESFDGRIWFANAYPDDGNYIISAPMNPDGTVNLNPANRQYFGRSDGLAIEDGISDIDFDDFGRLWIGTNGEGVYILDYNNTISNKSDDRLFQLKIDDNLSSDAVSSIAKDQDGIMWIGTLGGLSSFDGLNVFRHVGDEKGLDGPLDNNISQVFVDEFNNKWFATAGGVSILRAGRSAFEPGAWVGYNTANSGLLDNNVNSIFIDQERSEALIATESGISIFRGTFAEIQSTFDKVTAGPNPFIIDSEPNLFTIRKLRSNSTVKIFDLNGKLVRELSAENQAVDGSRAYWNGKDYNGIRVASGVYLYMAYTEDGKAATGKIAVIRK